MSVSRIAEPTDKARSNTRIGFTPLAAGQSATFTGHLTQNQYYDETHNINLTVDAGNEVAETNENDNLHATAPYILVRGDCG